MTGTTRRKDSPGQGELERFDYREGKALPAWVRDAIETHLAIEAEDAKKAGALGFMARALVIATMPYKDPKTDAFTRVNGDFKLRILAGYEGGIPYGIYPRFLLSWVATEAVRAKSRQIELGDSLSAFLRDVLDLRNTGGVRGTGTRVSEQMKRLFGSLITARYTGGQEGRGFALENILIADKLQLAEDAADSLWQPQPEKLAGSWKSEVTLSQNFFNECVSNPIPIDLRAYKALRGSPLAMDVYTWLTYRMSYTHRKTRPIRWESLMAQFGSGYGASSGGDSTRAVLDFKKNFLKALRHVAIVYPEARVDVAENGLILLPSKTHIPPKIEQRQPDLF